MEETLLEEEQLSPDTGEDVSPAANAAEAIVAGDELIVPPGDPVATANLISMVDPDKVEAEDVSVIAEATGSSPAFVEKVVSLVAKSVEDAEETTLEAANENYSNRVYRLCSRTNFSDTVVPPEGKTMEEKLTEIIDIIPTFANQVLENVPAEEIAATISQATGADAEATEAILNVAKNHSDMMGTDEEVDGIEDTEATEGTADAITEGDIPEGEIPDDYVELEPTGETAIEAEDEYQTPMTDDDLEDKIEEHLEGIAGIENKNFSIQPADIISDVNDAWKSVKKDVAVAAHQGAKQAIKSLTRSPAYKSLASWNKTSLQPVLVRAEKTISNNPGILAGVVIAPVGIASLASLISDTVAYKAAADDEEALKNLANAERLDDAAISTAAKSTVALANFARTHNARQFKACFADEIYSRDDRLLELEETKQELAKSLYDLGAIYNNEQGFWSKVSDDIAKYSGPFGGFLGGLLVALSPKFLSVNGNRVIVGVKQPSFFNSLSNIFNRDPAWIKGIRKLDSFIRENPNTSSIGFLMALGSAAYAWFVTTGENSPRANDILAKIKQDEIRIAQLESELGQDIASDLAVMSQPADVVQKNFSDGSSEEDKKLNDLLDVTLGDEEASDTVSDAFNYTEDDSNSDVDFFPKEPSPIEEENFLAGEDLNLNPQDSEAKIMEPDDLTAEQTPATDEVSGEPLTEIKPETPVQSVIDAHNEQQASNQVQDEMLANNITLESGTMNASLKGINMRKSRYFSRWNFDSAYDAIADTNTDTAKEMSNEEMNNMNKSGEKASAATDLHVSGGAGIDVPNFRQALDNETIYPDLNSVKNSLTFIPLATEAISSPVIAQVWDSEKALPVKPFQSFLRGLCILANASSDSYIDGSDVTYINNLNQAAFKTISQFAMNSMIKDFQSAYSDIHSKEGNQLTFGKFETLVIKSYENLWLQAPPPDYALAQSMPMNQVGKALIDAFSMTILAYTAADISAAAKNVERLYASIKDMIVAARKRDTTTALAAMCRGYDAWAACTKEGEQDCVRFVESHGVSAETLQDVCTSDNPSMTHIDEVISALNSKAVSPADKATQQMTAAWGKLGEALKGGPLSDVTLTKLETEVFPMVQQYLSDMHAQLSSIKNVIGSADMLVNQEDLQALYDEVLSFDFEHAEKAQFDSFARDIAEYFGGNSRALMSELFAGFGSGEWKKAQEKFGSEARKADITKAHEVLNSFDKARLKLLGLLGKITGNRGFLQAQIITAASMIPDLKARIKFETLANTILDYEKNDTVASMNALRALLGKNSQTINERIASIKNKIANNKNLDQQTRDKISNAWDELKDAVDDQSNGMINALRALLNSGDIESYMNAVGETSDPEAKVVPFSRARYAEDLNNLRRIKIAMRRYYSAVEKLKKNPKNFSKCFEYPVDEYPVDGMTDSEAWVLNDLSEEDYCGNNNMFCGKKKAFSKKKRANPFNRYYFAEDGEDAPVEEEEEVDEEMIEAPAEDEGMEDVATDEEFEGGDDEFAMENDEDTGDAEELPDEEWDMEADTVDNEGGEEEFEAEGAEYDTDDAGIEAPAGAFTLVTTPATVKPSNSLYASQSSSQVKESVSS